MSMLGHLSLILSISDGVGIHGTWAHQVEMVGMTRYSVLYVSHCCTANTQIGR